MTSCVRMDFRQPLRTARSSRRLARLLGCAAALVVTAGAHAQQQPLRITPPAVDAAEKANREQELERVRAEQKKAAENAAKLAAEIDAIGQDRRKLARALIETATRLRDVEARAAAAEARVKALADNERTIRTALEGRRVVIAELLAALQRIGRRPPPALMVRPEDALDSVRTAIMLGAVVPEMRIELETLAADLTELVRVRRDIAEERAGLTRDLASLSDERQRMTLLVEERQKRQSEAERALDSERQRAASLGRQADNLKDLIAKLEQDAASASRAAPETKDSGAAAGRNFAVLRDAPRLAPAVAFASAKGVLPLPVNGVKIKDYGAADKFGGVEKGLSMATRAGAQVTAPCDGWVVYAGPFRSYGQLLILNAGGGYHVLLAGMERISVDHGQFVLTGEPVAVMGGATQAAAAVAIGSSQPILYVEFRKDGTPVDPGPWWAATDSEKVRG
jgi:murein hydrolase activator